VSKAQSGKMRSGNTGTQNRSRTKIQ
jgi:hypothetical protein